MVGATPPSQTTIQVSDIDSGQGRWGWASDGAQRGLAFCPALGRDAEQYLREIEIRARPERVGGRKG